MNDLELKIAKFLRLGVLTAGFILLAGWLCTEPWQKENPFLLFREYQHLSLQQRVQSLYQQGQSQILVLYAGLVVLISLPILRVFLTAILFIRERDYLLAALALLVLFTLSLSLVLGWETH